MKYDYEIGVIEKKGKKVYLTYSENEVFNKIYNKEKKFITYEEIGQIIWGGINTDGSMRSMICRMNKKMEGICRIRAILLKGYQLIIE